ncbi:MAG: MauE/DoxX family redox-associated membrane protein [Chthoniobacterales bacterium]
MNEGEQKRSVWSAVVRRTLAFLAGAVFVYAGGIKLLDPMRFASDITNYQIVPWAVAIRLAFYLSWLELICGLALIFHRLFSGALCLTGGLMAIFIGATLLAKARGVDVTCGCFGSASRNLSFTWHLVLDLVLLGVLILLWFWRRPDDSLAAGSAAR